MENKTNKNFMPLIIGGISGVIFGFIASQYFPLFGGIATFGKPFSQARMSLISGHSFLFLFVGIGISYLIRMNKNNSSNK